MVNMRDDRDISKRLGIKYQMDLPLLVNRAAVSIMSWPEAKAYCAGDACDATGVRSS